MSKELDYFGLTSQSLDQIEQFFRFLANRPSRPILYDFLIIGDPNETSLFMDKFLENLYQKQLLLSEKTTYKEIKSLSFPTGNPEQFLGDSSYDTIVLQLDLDELLPTVSTTAIRESFRTLVSCARRHPEKMIFLCISGDLYFSLAADEYGCEKIFAHHIEIEQVRTELFFQEFLKRMENRNIPMSGTFQRNMKSYIEASYAASPQRGLAYVDDLENTVLSRYYSRYSPQDSASPEVTVRKLEKNDAPLYIHQQSYKNLKKQLKSYVGMEDMKNFYTDLTEKLQNQQKGAVSKLNFIFEGNPGTGKQTAAKFTADLLYAFGLRKNPKFTVVDLNNFSNDAIATAANGLLYLDVSFAEKRITEDKEPDLKNFLASLDRQMKSQGRNQISVILGGRKSDIEKMEQYITAMTIEGRKQSSTAKTMNPFSRKIKFPDFTVDQLVEIFKMSMASEDITLNPYAESELRRLIETKQALDDFANVDSMNDIKNTILPILNSKKKRNNVIEITDLMNLRLASDKPQIKGKMANDSMTSIENDFFKYMQYVADARQNGVIIPSPRLHMAFFGDPGTGKTTKAREMADMLYQRGLLKTNKLIIAERKDFIGPEGPEKKTGEMIQKAMNGVLFIDEAYTLSNKDVPDDPGKKVIETLLPAMDEYKGSLVIIFAGYTNEMREFLNINPGLYSRIGYKIEFPNFDVETLVALFNSKMQAYHFTFVEPESIVKLHKCNPNWKRENTGKVMEKVTEIMRYYSVKRGFGNGRFVDTVIDRTIRKKAIHYTQNFKDQAGYIDANYIPTIDELSNTLIDGETITSNTRNNENKYRVAVHESGHFLIAHYLEPDIKCTEISIKPTVSSNGRNNFNFKHKEGRTEENYKNYLAFLFGGRNAEKLILGSHSPGCSDDFNKAKNNADYMINKWAMGEIGKTTPVELLQKADEKATEILTAHKAELESLANALQESTKQELTAEEALAIIGQSGTGFCV